MNDTFTTSEPIPSGPRLFKWSIVFYKARWRVLAPILFASFLAVAVSILIPDGGILGSLARFVSFVVGFILSLAFFVAIVGDGISFRAAYEKGLSLIVPYLWVTLLEALAVWGGLVLFIVPGLILCILLSFSTYVLLAEDRRGLPALAQSWHYARGHVGQIVWRELFLLVSMLPFVAAIMLLVFLPWKEGPLLFLGAQLASSALSTFVLGPLTAIYSFGLFRALKEHSATPLREEDVQHIKRNIRNLITIGILGLIALIALFGYVVVHAPQ